MDEQRKQPDENLRSRLQDVFGDVLPDVTRDEIDDARAADDARSGDDDRLRSDRPPHHDRE